MLSLAQAQQSGAQQWAALQVERALHFALHRLAHQGIPGRGIGRRAVVELDHHVADFSHLLHRLLVHCLQRRAQDLVALHHCQNGALHCVAIEYPLEQHRRHRQVECNAARVDLVDDPEFLLRE